MTTTDRLVTTAFCLACYACYPRKLVLAAMCLLACVANACGQTPTWEQQQAICRIWCPDGSGGTGTLIGKSDSSGLVITANHVTASSGGACTVVFPSGERFPGRVLAASEPWDLAAISIQAPAVEPISVANYEQRKGEQLASAGYGGLKSHLAVSVGVVEMYADRGSDGDFEGLRISGTVRSGDSGGPVFNTNGELAGVLWGGSPEGVYLSKSKTVAAFLMQCPPGGCQPRWGGQPSYQPPMVPVQPRPQPVPQTPIASQPTQPGVSPDEYRKLVISFNQWVEHVKKIEGQMGPKGDKGDKGDPGPAADVDALKAQIVILQQQIQMLQNQKPYQPDYDVIAGEVQSRLPPIRVRQIDRNGNVVVAENGREEMNVRLGENLNLRYRNVDDAQLNALEERVRGLESE